MATPALARAFPSGRRGPFLVVHFHRLMAGPLMPDDLAEIRQFDNLVADRTDVAVTTLAERRRATTGAEDPRMGLRFRSLMKHRFPPCFLSLIASVRWSSPPGHVPAWPACGAHLAKLETDLVGNCDGGDGIVQTGCRGFIEFSLLGREQMAPSTIVVPTLRAANHRQDVRAIAAARQNRFPAAPCNYISNHSLKGV